MINAAIGDFKKNAFSKAGILTGGASMGFTGTKAIMASMKPPAAAAQAAAAQAAATPPPQGATKPTVGAASKPGGAIAGQSGTLLTGPGGVDTSSLNLGRNKLLGQ